MMNTFTIGQVARQAGLKPSAVRYYETHRIIPPAQRLPNGYRVYPGDTASWLRFIRHAQAFGMRLENIRELLNLAIGGTMPCERVRQLAREQLKQIDRKMRELQTLRGQLQKLVRLKARHPSTAQVCALIDGVAEAAGDEKPLALLSHSDPCERRISRSSTEPKGKRADHSRVCPG